MPGEPRPPARLLIVDDEVPLLQALCATLEGQGYHTTACSSPTEALQSFSEGDYDLLLSDLMMPGMNGIALLKAVLEQDPNLLVIIMTGHATVETAVDAMKSGAFDYVLKPIRGRDLQAAIERALKVRSLRMENIRLRSAMHIYELSMAAAFTLDPDQIIKGAARVALQTVQADEVSVLLPINDGNEFEVAITAGTPRPHLMGARIPAAGSICGWVRDNSQPVMLSGEVHDSRFKVIHPRPEIRSAISSPMVAGGEARAILNVNAIARKGFSQGDAKALEIICNIAGAALASAQFHKELERAHGELQVALHDLQRAQSKVIEQERLHALGQMASGIAHDFNNALGPVLGYSELLLMMPSNLDDREKTTRYLELIHTGAHDAATIVSRLREFYRVREETDAFLPVDLNGLVRQSVSLTQPKWKDQALLRGRDIEVKVDLNAVPSVSGNESELREVLTNLIFNAVDAMTEGGSITIRTGPDGSGGVLLEVEDTGSGMPDEVRRRCLEPFFTTKGTQGTGLGLAMTLGVIKRHDGWLDIDTELGRGTKFLIRLPAHAARTERAPEPRKAPVEKLRVLVAEDEDRLREVIADMLEGDGHTVVLAANGMEAFSKFQEDEFDLIITDRAMPGWSGDELAYHIMRHSPDTPILMLTGFATLMEAAGELPEGVTRLLAKPPSLNALRHALADTVSTASESAGQG